MKKYLPLIFIVFVIALGIGFYFPRNSKTQQPVQNKRQTYQVKLLKDRAEPAELIVKLGDMVQFDSQDGKNHNIAQGPGNDFKKAHGHQASGKDSGVFGPNEGYKVTFSKPGSYYFHDHLNPNIFVAVVAYEPKKGE